MNEKSAPSMSVKEDDAEVAQTTTYYTSKGNEDLVDDDGNPVQIKENNKTYAKATGRRLMIRIDDRGQLMNPDGLYANKVKMERWVPANAKAFQFYVAFLRTGNQMHLRHAERNLA